MFANGHEYSESALLQEQMTRFKLTGGRRTKSKALVHNIRKEQSHMLMSLTGRLKSIGAHETITAIEHEVHGGDMPSNFHRNNNREAVLNRDMAGATTMNSSVMRYKE